MFVLCLKKNEKLEKVLDIFIYILDEKYKQLGMNYTLQQLRVFIEVSRYESITKASEALFLTQPAVSNQLKKFQEQFDVPLTELIGRRIYLTDFGREIAQISAHILTEVAQMETMSQAHQGLLVGRLTISFVSTATYVMPYFLSEFLNKNNGVELRMDVTNKGRVVENMEKNEVDFSLVSVLPEHLQVNRVELMPNKLFLVRKAQPEKQTRYIQPKTLEKVPLIFRERGSATRQAMENFIRTHQLEVRKSIQLTSNEAVKQAVQAGLGYSVMPLIGLHHELQNNEVEVIPIKGLPITTYWNLIWLRNKRLSPVAERYLEYLEAHKEAIIKKDFAWYEGY